MADEEVGKLFIGGVDKDTSSDEFRTFFEKYGELVDCILMKDSNSEADRNRGFGFVRYKEPNCAEAVLKSSPLTLNGKKLDPKPCTPRGSAPKRQGDFSSQGGDNDTPCKIFVGGVPQGITDEDVTTAFSKYGKVKTVQLMRDKTNNRIKGFAFVTFETEGSAQQLCSIRFVECGGKTVECKAAESRFRSGGQNPGGQGGQSGYGGGPNWQGPGGGAPGGGGYNYGQGGGGAWGGQQQMGGSWGQQQQMGSYGGQGGYGARPNTGGPGGSYGGGYGAPQNGTAGYGAQGAAPGAGYGGGQYNQGGGQYGGATGGNVGGGYGGGFGGGYGGGGDPYGNAQASGGGVGFNQSGGGAGNYGGDMSGGSYGGAQGSYGANTGGGTAAGGQDMYGSGGPMSANYGQRMANSAQPFHPYRR